MSAKNRDEHNRWRNKTIGFRMSSEEAAQLDEAVRLSGLTKQDYITKKLLDREVIVQPSPRVYKALRDRLDEVLDELRIINDVQTGNDGLLETINLKGINNLSAQTAAIRYFSRETENLRDLLPTANSRTDETMQTRRQFLRFFSLENCPQSLLPPN